ncbi:DUF2982 domain-containing protein [Celerinatantimonas sp. YJH-8]|uniref:DUF2982 domain-containing protein n=1 Tax=Celerinatantimonas sp. YJH-8 TaxID=3228714 RepID=UPI0038C61AA3
METIKFPLAHRQNGSFFILSGIITALVSLLLLYIFGTKLFSIAASFMIILAYIGLRIGFSKIVQPYYGVVVCHDHLQFHHSYGGWSLQWSQIQRIGIPYVGRGFERRELGYIGLRIVDYQSILETISPRLCAHLLTEQRSALLAALRADCSNINSVSDQLLEDDYFVTQGKTYHGLLAMFGQRMEKLRQLTGYDLFIDQGVIDEPCEQFLPLIRQYLVTGKAALLRAPESIE